jgi:hypothetical protein
LARRNRLKWTRAIGVLEFGGSLWAIAFFGYTDFPSILHLPKALLMIPFSIGLFAGYKLMTDDPRGLLVSKWLQALQLVKLSGPAFCYEFFLGMKVAFGFRGPDLPIEIQPGATFWLWLNQSDAPLGVSVNLVALVAFVTLMKTPRGLLEKPEQNDSTERVPGVDSTG